MIHLLMIKRIAAYIGITLSSLFILTGVALAIPPLQTATLSTPGTTGTLTLPPAAGNSPVISLNTAVDPGTGKVVEGIAIIHRKSPARPGKPKPGTDTCYTYLSSGAKWKTVEPWVVNSSNVDGLGSSAVFNLLSGGVTKWEDAAGFDILGSGSATSSALLADTSSPDNLNEVYFADVSEPGVIAVTIVWGIFGGPPQGRKLVEWDQVYDDVSFDWSAEASGSANKMDFGNIATHELGHSVGMGDLYNSCVDETMYGFSSNAEIKKRDLNSGDITGVNALY